MMKMKYLVRRAVHFVFSEKVANLSRPGGPPDLSSISLYNVSCCVPILGTKNGTCLSDGPALRGPQKITLTKTFLRGVAAPVI